ncbi:MAG: hypothetical protein ACRDQZ_10370 [Mycobacteriales bacterium]
MSTAPVFRLPLNQLPPWGDLREWMGPRKDQGDKSSCTGHAYSSDKEWAARKYLGKTPILSPEFFYAMELKAEGSFPSDDGAMPRTGCLVLNSVGCCELSIFPNQPTIVDPSSVQIENAKLWKSGAFHRIVTVADAISCIADRVPWLFTVGFDVYGSFESSAVEKTGIMPVPDARREAYLGGHETLGGVAWDIGTTPHIRPRLCPPAVMIQNSWGADWGIDGCFWMPLEVLGDAKLVSDIWMIHEGRKWVPTQAQTTGAPSPNL